MSMWDTPWGKADRYQEIYDGIEIYGFIGDTPDCYHLSPERMRDLLRLFPTVESPWFQFGMEGCLVLIAFPFLPNENMGSRRWAKKHLINWFPGEYETMYGEKVKKGESHITEIMGFYRKNVDNWIAIEVLKEYMAVDDHTWLQVVATKGGIRDKKATRKIFVVRRSEYVFNKDYAFVIPFGSREIKKGETP